MSSLRIEAILDAVGANVRRLRTARGWSQKELAAATEAKGLKGVMWRSVQGIETGKANPTLRVLVALADVLGVALTDLLAPAQPGPPQKVRPPSAGTPSGSPPSRPKRR